MQADVSYVAYVAARAKLYPRLDELRKEIDGWLRQNADVEPTISAIAQLEALHAQRDGLLEELHRREEQFIDQLVSRFALRSSDSSSIA